MENSKQISKLSSLTSTCIRPYSYIPSVLVGLPTTYAIINQYYYKASLFIGRIYSPFGGDQRPQILGLLKNVLIRTISSFDRIYLYFTSKVRILRRCVTIIIFRQVLFPRIFAYFYNDDKIKKKCILYLNYIEIYTGLIIEIVYWILKRSIFLLPN